MTKKEKEARDAKKIENTRMNYHERKELIGYGRNHDFLINQIKQKIHNNIANPKERAKYEDYIIRKKTASKKKSRKD